MIYQWYAEQQMLFRTYLYVWNEIIKAFNVVPYKWNRTPSEDFLNSKDKLIRLLFSQIPGIRIWWIE